MMGAMATRTRESEAGFEAAFREHDDQIAAIARNPAAPDFDNTVLALEEAGALLLRIERVEGDAAGLVGIFYANAGAKG
mgnify:CR=1 FL=1